MLARVNADRFEALEIALLRVTRVRLQDDLELMVHLHAIRILPEAAVVGTDAGLDVHHIPGLWAEDAQGRSRIHRASAHLDIVGLLYQAALLLPVGQQAQDNILKAQGRTHDCPSLYSGDAYDRTTLSSHAAKASLTRVTSSCPTKLV